MITLYDCSTAPSPRRARLLLAAKGIAHASGLAAWGRAGQLNNRLQ